MTTVSTRQRPQRPLGPRDAIAPLRPKHGLSRTEIRMLLAGQGGRCLICQDAIDETTAVVDHDHALAAVHPHPVTRGCRLCIRGLLDDKCNRMLGAARDNPETLRRAAAYLELARPRLAVVGPR